MKQYLKKVLDRIIIVITGCALIVAGTISVIFLPLEFCLKLFPGVLLYIFAGINPFAKWDKIGTSYVTRWWESV